MSRIDDAPSSLSFTHRFVPGQAGNTRTLLLLHGTGGNEDSLLQLGRALAPGAALLSPRGQVLEQGMPRFFRRFAEGVFDVVDLKARTHDLADFIRAAAREYRLDPAGITAVGFSNGANIAASLLLLHPGLVRSAILFRVMLPFEPENIPALASTRVRLGAGRHDPIIAPENVSRLAQLLEQAGASVSLDWREAGHQLAPGEIEAAATWLASGS